VNSGAASQNLTYAYGTFLDAELGFNFISTSRALKEPIQPESFRNKCVEGDVDIRKCPPAGLITGGGICQAIGFQVEIATHVRYGEINGAR